MNAQTLVSAEAPEVQAYVKDNSARYMMKSILGRRCTAQEVGQEHRTYVPDPDGNIMVEGTNTHAEGKIVVRFPVPIGEKDGVPVYNEWLVREADFIKKYGGKLPEGTDWETFQKSAPDSFAVIDENLMELFGASPGESQVKVGVSWAADGTMWAIKGGYATGYHVIAPAMAKMMYDPV